MLSYSSQCSLSNKKETFNPSSLTTKPQCTTNISYQFMVKIAMQLPCINLHTSSKPKGKSKSQPKVYFKFLESHQLEHTFFLSNSFIRMLFSIPTQTINVHCLIHISSQCLITTRFYIVANLLYQFLSYSEVLVRYPKTSHNLPITQFVYFCYDLYLQIKSSREQSYLQKEK